MNDTKEKATESINALIARYGRSQGFLGIYDLVGAVASGSGSTESGNLSTPETKKRSGKS